MHQGFQIREGQAFPAGLKKKAAPSFVHQQATHADLERKPAIESQAVRQAAHLEAHSFDWGAAARKRSHGKKLLPGSGRTQALKAFS